MLKRSLFLPFAKNGMERWECSQLNTDPAGNDSYVFMVMRFCLFLVILPKS